MLCKDNVPSDIDSFSPIAIISTAVGGTPFYDDRLQKYTQRLPLIVEKEHKIKQYAGTLNKIMETADLISGWQKDLNSMFEDSTEILKQMDTDALKGFQSNIAAALTKCMELYCQNLNEDKDDQVDDGTMKMLQSASIAFPLEAAIPILADTTCRLDGEVDTCRQVAGVAGSHECRDQEFQ